jgi:hypothetical protein
VDSNPLFSNYIGIDYSGAETPNKSLRGLRVFMASREADPVEVLPPPSPRKYWTRRGIAEWLRGRLMESTPTLVGIDHGFSFPLAYFDKHQLGYDWDTFLDDFQRHWPTDGDGVYVDFVREGVCGDGAKRTGSARWRRLTEIRAGGAKSVFHFDVQGSVAKSTHAGLPWLRYVRRQVGGRCHIWPFDGWEIPVGISVVAEVYPALWSRSFPTQGRDSHQQDAYSTAAWMRRADRNGWLPGFFRPELGGEEQRLSSIEGWILGVA